MIRTLIAFLAAASCCATLAGAAVYEVAIVDFQFIPSVLQIEQGDSVHWVNGDAVIHTVTSGVECLADGLFDSGNLSAGGEFGFTFDQVGVVPYFCIPHCPGMTARIEVDEKTSTKLQTWGRIRSIYR